jgi:glucosamine--fructose-6-phosphate aminotransferase (isomerizing)
MCGIMGVLGIQGAPALVRRGLQALEYRGYDSCGVVWTKGAELEVAKALGTVSGLVVPPSESTMAVGHTRWATHGGVTIENAHPHLDATCKAAVVHNGVLLNHLDMRRELEADGVKFLSETDSEVLVHYWMKHQALAPRERLNRLQSVLQGTYSVAMMDAADQTVYIAKQRNPLWVAKTDDGVFLASDPIALRPHTSTAIPLEDGDHGKLSIGSIELWDASGASVERPAVDISHLDDSVHRAGYEHFMLKEIHETPSAINRILAARVRQNPPYIDLVPAPFLNRFQSLLALGAGTSYHAGLLGAEFSRRIARIPANARPTPEFKDDLDIPDSKTLLVAMSQSGETLDTLQALHRLRSHPHPTLALTNHPTSSIGRMADQTVSLQSGTEVSVAATKTFLSQSLLMYLLVLAKARRTGTLSDAGIAHAVRHLIRLPRAIERTLQRTEAVQEMARKLSKYDNLFILAKGIHLPAALEGALKLKEIAYQHAEAYPAGELKHGPFALLTSDTPVVFLLAPDRNESSILNSLHEVHARGAPTFVVAMEGSKDPGTSADHVIWLPDVRDELTPFIFSSALHLLSYWVAKARGLPIDKPRNLAKSVTVE